MAAVNGPSPASCGRPRLRLGRHGAAAPRKRAGRGKGARHRIRPRCSIRRVRALHDQPLHRIEERRFRRLRRFGFDNLADQHRLDVEAGDGSEGPELHMKSSETFPFPILPQ